MVSKNEYMSLLRCLTAHDNKKTLRYPQSIGRKVCTVRESCVDTSQAIVEFMYLQRHTEVK